jgi:hypothetical protein
MKKIKIEKMELKRIINDLEKASDTFDGFGSLIWDMQMPSENEEKQYDESGELLRRSITKLNKVRGYKKKRI